MMDDLGWSVERVSSAVGIASLLAFYGYKRKSLDSSGAVSAFFTGTVTFASSVKAGLALIAFFLSASKLTKYKSSVKKKIEYDFKEGGQRTWKQVFCNSAFATTFALLASIFSVEEGTTGADSCWDSEHSPKTTFCSLAVLGFYSCVNGDTWASELGILAEGDPFLITSFRRVPRGTNGGVSLLGLVASLGGGAFVGFVLLIHDLIVGGCEETAWAVVVIGALAGLMGSLIDSILGATLQSSYEDQATGTVASEKIKNGSHISGLNLLSNDAVNLWSALFTSLLTAWLFLDWY